MSVCLPGPPWLPSWLSLSAAHFLSPRGVLACCRWVHATCRVLVGLVCPSLSGCWVGIPICLPDGSTWLLFLPVGFLSPSASACGVLIPSTSACWVLVHFCLLLLPLPVGSPSLSVSACCGCVPSCLCLLGTCPSMSLPVGRPSLSVSTSWVPASAWRMSLFICCCMAGPCLWWAPICSADGLALGFAFAGPQGSMGAGPEGSPQAPERREERRREGG